MKKLLIFVIGCIICININALPEDLYGGWKLGKVELTINKDTLYIDEIDNEGDIYVYTLKNDTIYCYNEFNWDSPTIKIVSLDKRVLILHYIDEPNINYTFRRKKAGY